MKKRALSVFLISLVMPLIANCIEDLAAGYTYINESSFDKVRFNADKSLDIFNDDEWEHFDFLILDKNNLNFIGYRSENPEFYERDEKNDMLFGFLSKDGKTLYMGEGYNFIKEESEKNSQAVTGDTYYGSDGVKLIMVRFNTDKSFDVFDDEWVNIGIVLSEEGTQNFILCDNKKVSDSYMFGFFAEDGKLLYLAVGDRFRREDTVSTKPKAEKTTESEFLNPALTVDSIDVGGITFHSTPEDVLIQYASAQLYKSMEDKEDNDLFFFVHGLDGFTNVSFNFKDDKLVAIVKLEIDRDDKDLSKLVEKTIWELIAKYGKPAYYESSLKSYVHARYYTWVGEAYIRLNHERFINEEDGNCKEDRLLITYVKSVF